MGLFAWLIIHWILDLDYGRLNLLSPPSSVVYLRLIGVEYGVRSRPCVRRPCEGRLVPVNPSLEGVIDCGNRPALFAQPKLARRIEDVDSNPILFATVVMPLLYRAAMVGISYAGVILQARRTGPTRL